MKGFKLYVTALACCLAATALHSCGGGKTGAAFAGGGERDSLEYAVGLGIERCDGYVCVTVRDPWDTLKVRQRYLLVDRDAPEPDELPEGTIIRIPILRAAVYTSVHSSLVEQIGCLENICGVCDVPYLTSGIVRKAVADGSIADLGSSTSPDIEQIIDLQAEIIIASPLENLSYGAAEKIGVPIVEAADYMENHPLGRTEWVKFFGLLFGREALTDSLYNATAAHYKQLKDLAASADRKPSLLLEMKYGPSWGVPSGVSYIGVLQADAGANYIFRDISRSSGCVQLSMEEVFDKAGDADFWLFKYNAPDEITYDGLQADCPMYAKFKAFREKRIYACNSNDNPYYDDVTLHPDLILEDLIAIYHPGILSDHVFRYYRPLR